MRNEIFPILETIFRTATTAAWVERLEKAGIPAGAILTVDQTLSLEQTKAREMVVEMDHPKAGLIKMTGVPIKLSATPGEAKTPPPVLGDSTETILAEVLGYNAETIEKLKNEGVV